MSQVLNDLDLVRRCAYEGDGQAWETFAGKYSPVIWSSVQKTFRAHFFPCRQEDVEDVFNSVFLALIESDFNKLRQYRGENSCSLQTWLAVVTIRMTIDYMRKDRRHLQVEPLQEGGDILENIPSRGRSPHDALEDKQTRTILVQALSGLPPGDRLIYRLLCERGVSPEQTAKILDISVATIYSRKNRIIGKLKKIISDVQENGTSNV